MGDSHYVPIEERWLGLDKRAIPHAVVMIALIALLVYVIPAINDAVGWDDETVAGDVIDLGGGIVITPPVGWLLEDGIRTSDEPTVPVNPESATTALAHGGVTVSVAASGWDRTAEELLDQANLIRENSGTDDNKLFKVTGGRDSVTTSGGITGVSETFTSATGDGKMFAFVLPAGGEGSGAPIGVVISATGSGDNLGGDDDAIEMMVSSLTTAESVS